MIALASVIILGIGAQWVAWRLKLPSILLLLMAGLLAGPVARHFFPGSHYPIDPDTILGSDLLLALVGIAVSLILYEGGLTLSFKEIAGVKKVVFMLVTVAAAVTWVIAGTAAWFLFKVPVEIAALIGAVLIVTGPTVVGPLLGHIRPSGSSGLILKWEGIVIDPIGVLVAVLVFEAILITHNAPGTQLTGEISVALIKTIVGGSLLGVLSAMVLLTFMTRFWIPDSLQNPFSLMLVVATFVGANAVQEEAGLLATTVMGITLANQKRADVRHILEFKENLRVLFISALFIVLGAQLQLEDLLSLDWAVVAGFLVVLVVVARPIGVWLATIGSGLTNSERLFMSWMAPRGIVAAAGASIFALGLEKAGVPGTEQIVPIVFAVIIGTVAIYGLTATPVARALGISDQNPQGIVFIGAPRWVRAIAKALTDRGIRVLLVDTNRGNIRAALMDEIPARHANILDEWVLDELDLRGIGRTFAVTPNDEVNTLALQQFSHVFDTAGLFRLPTKAAAARGQPSKKPAEKGKHRITGRPLFTGKVDFANLESRMGQGWVVKATTLSDEFTLADYDGLYGRAALKMFAITPSGLLHVATEGRPFTPGPGDTIIALVNPDELFMPSMAETPEPEA
ncbi:MAG: NhaP-type Na+/H+ or K+/H+ antiporter [Phycisphaerales bacterium]|jgi:NhaP-type Na+/H+ or K+/H+ antiporter